MKFWHLAARNHEAAMHQIEPHLQGVSSWLLSTAEHTSLDILQFIVAIMISGYLLARAKSGQQFTLLILERFVGERGQKVIDLVYAIVHSVALGIVGVAVIQAILAGLSFIVVGVPFAGLWAVLCLLLSVVQIGIAPVIIPIIIYLFYSADTFTAVIFLIWSIPVTLIDNYLRAIFFSRGVKTPMVIVFMGSLGGFMASGIVGLFTGAVVLSLSYGLFMHWVKEGSREMKT
jgi:predicted PurR-regulated permease PerM